MIKGSIHMTNDYGKWSDILDIGSLTLFMFHAQF
jgi:hypothetical protein